MVMYIVSRKWAYANCPPDDRPWLVSCEEDIVEAEQLEQEFTKKWLKECPYPGNASSKQAKMSWFQKIKDKHKEQELEDATLYEISNAPEPTDIVRDVLLQRAPKSLVVELCVSKTHLESIEALDNEKAQAQFSSNLSIYARNGYTGERTWSAYKRWLLEVDQPQTTTTTNLVTFGHMICGSDDELLQKCEEFAWNMGMGVVEFQCIPQQPGVAGYGHHDKVGENMYYPLPNKNNSHNPVGFTVKMDLKPLQTETDRAEYKFHSKLKEMERASLTTDDPKTYMLVQREGAAAAFAAKNKTSDNNNDNKENQDDNVDNENDNQVPTTAEYFHVLWLPHDYLQHRKRIQAHLDWGKGEGVRMQERLQKGNTDTGNLKIQMIDKELTAAKQPKKGQKKATSALKQRFCAILALTEVAASDTRWMQDNEFPEHVIEKLISKDLATYWRMSLLKRDDQALGIGNEQQQQQVSSPEEVSESRKALHILLKLFAKQFEDGGGYFAKVKFNWKLGHSRNPKALNGMNKRQKVAVDPA